MNNNWNGTNYRILNYGWLKMEITVLMVYTVIDELSRGSVCSGNSGPVNIDELVLLGACSRA